MGAIFTVDWESYFNAVIPKEYWANLELDIDEPTHFLLDILDKYDIKAIFYVLGWLRYERFDLYNEIEKRGHVMGYHGYWHERNEKSDGALFRSPYWDTTPMPWPPAGGFFFRIIPVWYIKWAVKRSGVMWLHPHDVMKEHPRLSNPFLNFKRQIGIKQSRLKLEKLLNEIEWENPRNYL